jgi:hypothetical protein
MRFPPGNSIMSTWGLMFVHFWFLSPATSISLSKWPMLPTIAMSFIRRMWSTEITSLLPVAVMKMSAEETTSSSRTTSKPSIAACSAQIGSISVTFTRAPAPASEAAEPLPTSP